MSVLNTYLVYMLDNSALIARGRLTGREEHLTFLYIPLYCLICYNEYILNLKLIKKFLTHSNQCKLAKVFMVDIFGLFS